MLTNAKFESTVGWMSEALSAMRRVGANMADSASLIHPTRWSES
jgi:hypothetical protein